MKTTKKKIIQYSSIAALLLAGTLNGNAQNFELGFRYEPEFEHDLRRRFIPELEQSKS